MKLYKYILFGLLIPIGKFLYDLLLGVPISEIKIFIDGYFVYLISLPVLFILLIIIKKNKNLYKKRLKESFGVIIFLVISWYIIGLTMSTIFIS